MVGPGAVARSNSSRCLASSPGLRIYLAFFCSPLWRQLIEIVQRIVVIRGRFAIIFPTKMVKNIEPLPVYGVEKVLIIAVNLMNEGNLLALLNAK